MALTDDQLETCARRAYERGRLRAALPIFSCILPMTVLSLALCGQPTVSLAIGALLLLVASGSLWRGQGYGTGVVPGLLAGAAPLLLPLLVRQAGHLCVGGSCWSLCAPTCFVGGTIAGLVLGWHASRLDEGRATFLLSGCAVAGLAGALGCAVAGLSGMMGMVGGVFLGGIPPLLAAQMRHI